MSRFSTDYQVGRHTGVCAATGRALEPGEVYIAALCDREDDEGFDRVDYSLESWQAGERPRRLFSFWRAVAPRPDQKPRLLVDDAVLMDIFERLGDDDRPQRVAFRFVLGLILLRKRLLRYTGRSTGADQSERWLMLPKGADPDQPPIELINPHLTPDDVRELTEQLSEILQSEL